jgi:hypothetical protein
VRIQGDAAFLVVERLSGGGVLIVNLVDASIEGVVWFLKFFWLYGLRPPVDGFGVARASFLVGCILHPLGDAR